MKVKATNRSRKKQIIEWRSHEPSRLETFSDAVFAFAVTLIVLSLQVPKSFTELFDMMKGTLSFAACFAALFAIWNNQNKFFRYYGLNDALTVSLNGILLFVVLVYVYPLKFLFDLLFLQNQYSSGNHLQQMITTLQIPVLMMIYGLGYMANNLLFCLMHWNALRHKELIKLNEVEQFETHTTMSIYLICTFIGVGAIILAYLLPLSYAGFSGFFYSAIGPAYFIWYKYRGRKRTKIFGPIELLTV